MCYNITNRTHLKFITAWNTCYCWSCGLSFTPMSVIFYWKLCHYKLPKNHENKRGISPYTTVRL